VFPDAIWWLASLSNETAPQEELAWKIHRAAASFRAITAVDRRMTQIGSNRLWSFSFARLETTSAFL